MLMNVIRTTCQAIYRDRLYALLNLAGLVTGFSCFLVIALYLRHEYTTDRHIANHDNIYRLVSSVDVGAQHTAHARVGNLVAPLLAQDYEQFEHFVRFNPVWVDGSSLTFMTEAVSLELTGGIYNVDSSVIDIFGLAVIAGNPETALTQPRTLAISESLARSFFGDEDPIGKTLGAGALSNRFTIDLVFADLPGNSSLDHDVLFSYADTPLAESPEGNFDRGIVQFNDYTYFLLPENYDVAGFGRIADDFFDRYVSSGAQQMFPGQEATLRLELEPLDAVYFSEPRQEDLPKANSMVLMALAVVAVFILGVACVNYMTLSTARYSTRSREAGIRRTLGAGTGAVALQFQVEALLFTWLSLLLAVSLTELLLSTALDLTYLGMELSLSHAGSAFIICLMLGVTALGMLSGAYPGAYFSSIRPLDIFKPVMHISRLGISLRNLLVGLQLLVSIVVTASALVMYAQVHYLKTRSPAFDTQHKLDIDVSTVATSSEYQTVRNLLASHPGVRNVTMTDVVPGARPYNQPIVMTDDAGEEVSLQGFGYFVDENFLDTFDIPLISGRNFSAVMPASGNVRFPPLLVNETLVRTMGWKNPIGKRIKMPADDAEGEIIGVIGDFNFMSLHEGIQPLALDRFYDNHRWQRHYMLDYDPAQLASVLEHAQNIMQGFVPGQPLNYSFLDDNLDLLYRNEQRLMQIVLVSAGLSIVISLLGIFGLTAYTLDQGAREIAIRRVMGGTLAGIIALKFRVFFGAFIIASLMAVILVFRLLGHWLDGFAYHVSIDPLYFLAAAGLVLVMIIITVMVQCMKTAATRPVSALRYE